MYTFFHGLLADKKGGEIFVLFGFWHFFYIALTVAVITAVMLFWRGKDRAVKEKIGKCFIYAAFALYMADFFLMPLAYGEINIEKLPFHACTTMCLICFMSYHVKFLEKYRTSFAMLGFISNFVYLICPAGVMWYEVHPSSYRVIQTLLFHGVMAVYGFLTLAHSYKEINFKKCYRDLLVIVCMISWALLGNYIYNATTEGYSHFFNWFFVVQDPFNLFPQNIAPYIMPFLNVVLFFTAEILIHLVIMAAKKIQLKKAALV